MKQKYIDAVRRSAVNSSLEQVNKFGLQMFYTADLSGQPPREAISTRR